MSDNPNPTNTPAVDPGNTGDSGGPTALSASDAELFLAAYDRALAAIDEENPHSLYFQKPHAAERARRELQERHEIRARIYGVEPKQPLTLEQKVERELDEQWGIDKHLERWAAQYENDIVKPLAHLQSHTITWSNGFPLSEADNKECRELLAQGKPLQGTKYEYVKVLPAPNDVLEGRRAAVREEFGAERYEQMKRDALYCERFDPTTKLPLGWDGDRYVIRFLAAKGAYLRNYDNARAVAKLPRRAVK